jgi:hypothetical protein
MDEAGTNSRPAELGDELILEGIVTTLSSDGSPNISPMGPRVDRQLTRLTLRPFQTSQTYQNLKRHGEGVFHVTDDVELIARAAVGKLAAPPALLPTAYWRLPFWPHGLESCPPNKSASSCND